jgi:hypothetical protein
MQHVPSWLQAALVPDRWNVAGVSCGVLTVWHHFALGCSGNAYLWGGETDHDAAAELLLYCSGDYAAGKRLFAQPFYRARRMRRIDRILRRRQWQEIDAACRYYVRSCLRTPQHVQIVSTSNGAPPKPAKAPLAWVLVQFLCAGNPAQIRAAWNTPYATAQCLFDAHRDITGECDSLEDADQERRMDELQVQRQEGAA